MNSLTRPRAILKWLGRAAKRSRHTFAFTGNNMHYTAIASLFMLDFAMAGILLLIMGIIVVLPMSSDPLRAIPPARMRIWPLEGSERRVLRLLSPLLNPLTWIVVALAVWKGASLGIVALAAGVVAAGFLTSARASGGGVALWRGLPNLPVPLNHLIRKNLREMLSTLDFFCGALIAGPLWAGVQPVAASRGLLPAHHRRDARDLHLRSHSLRTRWRCRHEALPHDAIAWLADPAGQRRGLPRDRNSAGAAALDTRRHRVGSDRSRSGSPRLHRESAAPVTLAIPDWPVVRRCAWSDHTDGDGGRRHRLFESARAAHLHCRVGRFALVLRSRHRPNLAWGIRGNVNVIPE